MWPRVRLVLRACLRKDPKQRAGDVAELCAWHWMERSRRRVAGSRGPGESAWFLAARRGRRCRHGNRGRHDCGRSGMGDGATIACRRLSRLTSSASMFQFRWVCAGVSDRGMQFAVWPDDRQVAVILADQVGNGVCSFAPSMP